MWIRNRGRNARQRRINIILEAPFGCWAKMSEAHIQEIY